MEWVYIWFTHSHSNNFYDRNFKVWGDVKLRAVGETIFVGDTGNFQVDTTKSSS